nr:beta-galactosidase (EC 3.2.1.23) isozyme 12 - Arthrobacter sp. (strain B7) [Arthrobacter sp.]AAA75601.1 beta-galactosidase [Arthrobacter sp.]
MPVPTPLSEGTTPDTAAQELRTNRLWEALPGLSYGGDYIPNSGRNRSARKIYRSCRKPECRPSALASSPGLGLEPVEGSYDFTWLDEVMDNLAATGIKVALATATAAPPAMAGYASIQKSCPSLLREARWDRLARTISSSAWYYSVGQYAAKMTRALAERYKDHPALALWHVDNELGCHVSEFYGPRRHRRFPSMAEPTLRHDRGPQRGLGTAFWSQRYSCFEEILTPRPAPTTLNPTQQLDFQRFSSWGLIDFYSMLARGHFARSHPRCPPRQIWWPQAPPCLWDYFDWAKKLECHRQWSLPGGRRYRCVTSELAFRRRSDSEAIAGGKPWSPDGALSPCRPCNWLASQHDSRTPGEMARNSLVHVGRGIWMLSCFSSGDRASRVRRNSTRPWCRTPEPTREYGVKLLSWAQAQSLVRGSRRRGGITHRNRLRLRTLVGKRTGLHPAPMWKYLELLRAFHAPCSCPASPPIWSIPALTLTAMTWWSSRPCTPSPMPRPAILRQRQNAEPQCSSATSVDIDENDAVRLGGYPGAFRDLLGVNVEEFHPLPENSTVSLDAGWSGRIWSEHVHLTGAEAKVSFTEAPLTGVPAVTRHAVGTGAAWYLATFPDATGLESLLDSLIAESGVRAPAMAAAGV